jgi:hypothetical protein
MWVAAGSLQDKGCGLTLLSVGACGHSCFYVQKWAGMPTARCSRGENGDQHTTLSFGNRGWDAGVFLTSYRTRPRSKLVTVVLALWGVYRCL